TFTTLINNVTLDQQCAQAVKAQLSQVGVDMTIMTIDASQHTARRASGDFEGSIAGISTSPDPDFDIRPHVQTGANRNYGNYSNPKVDELIDQAAAAPTREERQRAYYQIQSIILDDVPVVILHHDADTRVMKASVQGYEPTLEAIIGGLDH